MRNLNFDKVEIYPKSMFLAGLPVEIPCQGLFLALLHYSRVLGQVKGVMSGLQTTLRSFTLVHLKAVKDREEDRQEVSAGAEQLGVRKASTQVKEANTTASDQSDNGVDSRLDSAGKQLKRANTVDNGKPTGRLQEQMSLVELLDFIEEAQDAVKYLIENEVSNKELYERFKHDAKLRDLHQTVHQFISQ